MVQAKFDEFEGSSWAFSWIRVGWGTGFAASVVARLSTVLLFLETRGSTLQGVRGEAATSPSSRVTETRFSCCMPRGAGTKTNLTSHDPAEISCHESPNRPIVRHHKSWGCAWAAAAHELRGMAELEWSLRLFPSLGAGSLQSTYSTAG
jgi:hypothetical protein